MAKVPSSKRPPPPAGEVTKPEALAQAAKKRATTRGEQYLLRAYHGTKYNFPLSELRPTTASGMIGAGVNVTPDRDIAARYAAGIRKGDTDIAEKLQASTGNVLEMDIPFNEARVLEQNPSMRTSDMVDRFTRMVQNEGLEGLVSIDQHSPAMRFQHEMKKKYGDNYYDQYTRAMKEAGFDFVRDTRGGFEEIAVLDPKAIRAVADRADDELMSSRIMQPLTSAARKAFSSPTAKRIAGTVAGVSLPKAAQAAIGAATGPAMDLMSGPVSFLTETYPRSQDPYYQLKKGAELAGRPFSQIDPAGFDNLTYEAVERAMLDGHITPEAEQQFVDHLREKEGVDIRGMHKYLSPYRGL